MSKVIVRKARKEEISKIISLQNFTHFSNVSDNQKEKEGFVSVRTNIDQLNKLNKRVGVLVAVSGNKVIGYEMPLDLDIAREIILLDPFIERFLKIDYKGKKIKNYKWIIEGQINIQKEYKGMGIAEKLHKEFIKILKPKYELIVTEISDQNPRSLYVHTKKLGFKIIQTYSSNGRNWHILIQDIKEKNES